MSKASESSFHNSNTLEIYMREISAHPLLAPEEEIFLSCRSRAGNRAAADLLVKANLRLVVKIANDYLNMGVAIGDLVGEGNMGLMKAVEKFDPTKGGKLSTYAAWWIKQSIKRGLHNQGKTIRMPTHMIEKMSKVRRAAQQMSLELGREPSMEEVAEEVGMDARNLTLMNEVYSHTVSLDAPIDAGGDETHHSIGEVIADVRAEDPSEAFNHTDHIGALRRVLECTTGALDSRERSIIMARFGIDGKDPETLEQVGERMGVTRERIRQIQDKALRKLHRAMQTLEHVKVDGAIIERATISKTPERKVRKYVRTAKLKSQLRAEGLLPASSNSRAAVSVDSAAALA